MTFRVTFTGTMTLMGGCLLFSTWLMIWTAKIGSPSLGEMWTDFDNIGVYLSDLFGAVRDKAQNPESMIPELMSDEERMAFEALPEQITIYRGCGPQNLFGFSWSLDRRVAEEFPFPARYKTDEPRLLTALINRKQGRCLGLDCGEQEVIVFGHPGQPSIHWTMEPLHMATGE